MKIIKESIIKTYRENNILQETIQQFFYDNSEERERHKLHMESLGFEDSGQVKENIGNYNKPVYIDFGSYYKANVIN